MGEVTQEVSVTEAAPQLKSETSEVATGVSPKAFLDLPLNAGGGRSAESFIFLAPGTTGTLSMLISTAVRLCRRKFSLKVLA